MTNNQADPREKLNIYREEEAVVYPKPAPSRLELAAKETRTTAQKYAAGVHDTFQYYINKWIHFEQRTEETIKSLKQPEEAIMPNLLYVGATGLASLIVARRRNILVRALLPPLSTVAAAYYLIPRTTDATVDLIRRGIDNPEVRGRVEQHAPELVRGVDLARQHAHLAKEQSLEWKEEREAQLQGVVSQAREDLQSIAGRVRSSLSEASSSTTTTSKKE